MFARVTTLTQLENELDVAARQGRPAFVDVTAEWCISCKIGARAGRAFETGEVVGTPQQSTASTMISVALLLLLSVLCSVLAQPQLVQTIEVSARRTYLESSSSSSAGSYERTLGTTKILQIY